MDSSHNKASALEDLKKARQGKSKRTNQFKLEDDEDDGIVGEVDNESMRGFVVDDDGYGYDEEDDEIMEDDEPKKGKKTAKKTGEKKAKKTAKAAPAKASVTIGDMFTRAKATASQKMQMPSISKPVAKTSSDLDLDSLIDNIADDPMDDSVTSILAAPSKSLEVHDEVVPEKVAPKAAPKRTALDDMEVDVPIPVEPMPAPTPKSAPKKQAKAPKPAQKNYAEEDDEKAVLDASKFTGEDWWKAAEQADAALAESLITKSDTKKLPLDADGNLLVYWFDATNDFFNPGVVYLFGKVYLADKKQFQSICVMISNVERILHLCPRPNQSTESVRTEFDTIRKSFNIPNYMSKEVSKTYHFDVENIPQGTSKYLEVVYPFAEPELPAGLSGQTFVHTFGSQRSALETFIIDRKLMGPCWLLLKAPTPSQSPSTWCNYECHITKPWEITVATFSPTFPRPPTPVATVIAIKAHVTLNQQRKNEILSLSAIVKPRVELDGPTETSEMIHFTLLQKQTLAIPYDFEQQCKAKKNANIQVFNNERALLTEFLAKMQQYDPDFIVGHNITQFELDIILHRLSELNIQTWSQLGRLRKSRMPKLRAESSWAVRSVTAGRLVCDTYPTSQELYKSKNYKLGTLSMSLLNVLRKDLDTDEMATHFSTTANLLALCEHAVNDAYLSMQIMFKLDVLPLTKQLTELCGNLWARSLTGARAERNEYLLLHKFAELEYILPDKAVVADEFKKGKDAKYKGGHVLEPKRGFYDSYILLLDFNSLYPSIIQEYNICFTTIARAKDEKGEWLKSEPPSPTAAFGVLPKAIRQLVEKRKEVKKLLASAKTPALQKQYNIRQLAIKLVANSMYGCLGFKHSRFFALPMAELITRKGREAIGKAQEVAKSLNVDIIYGDTDSIMIDSHCRDLDQVKEIGRTVKQQINSLYKQLEIDIDGIYKNMLLLRKKKYAALAIVQTPNGGVEYQRTEKGLDLVRRDWCDLSGEMGRYVLGEILSEKSREDIVDSIHSYLRSKAEAIRAGKEPLTKFVITKTISKAPEEYHETNPPAHVKVALDLKKAGKAVHVGDYIQYAVVVPPTASTLLSDCCFHPDDISKHHYSLDIDWYLENQVHPPISRLCEPIEGTDSALLAECLGIDTKKYQQRQIPPENSALLSTTFEAEKYKSVEKLVLRCRNCTLESEFLGVWASNSVNDFYSSLYCHHCKTDKHTEVYSRAYVLNSMTQIVRKTLQKYYDAKYVCEDRGCGNSTTTDLFFKKAQPHCGQCFGPMFLDFDHVQIYMQLKYFQDLGDVDKALSRLPDQKKNVEGDRTLLDEIKERAGKYLKDNRYTWVDMRKLFGFYQ